MSSNKVYVKQERNGKRKWYRGVVIGRQGFIRTTSAILDIPAKEYNEDKLLVRMSNGEQLEVWTRDVYSVKPSKE